MMRTNILTFLMVIIAEFASFGQATLPPVFEIETDTLLFQIMQPSYYQLLEDKAGNWTIQDVTSTPLTDRFRYRNEKVASRDTLTNTYWFRYRLKNKMNREAKIALNSSSNSDDFYWLEPDGKWKCSQAGSALGWSKRDGLKRTGSIPIILQPGVEHIVYERIKNDDVGLNANFQVLILGTDKIVKQFYIDYVNGGTSIFSLAHLQVAFLEGLLFLALFINLLFFRIVREKVYLYFSLFILFILIDQSYFVLLDYCAVAHPAIIDYLKYLTWTWAFIPYFLVQFFRYFFCIKITYPRWDKCLMGLAILNLALFVLALILNKLLGYKQISSVIVYFSIIFIVPLSIIVTLFLFANTREKSVRYMIIGSFPYILFTLVTIPSEFVAFLHIEKYLPVFYGFLMTNYTFTQIICLAWLVLCFSWILFIRYDRLFKENAQQALDKERLAKEREMEKSELIEMQKAALEQQVTERTADLKHSLENLKSTQSQLIQSEKMASLGELTAGIAHEIQNPLNFVNNFSEVSTELLDEMQAEMEKGNTEDVKQIVEDLKHNLEKINHHGKRADSIVKGMLQHSRASSGVKEPTDINQLADEYLRLAYHGLRAKDKSFNAKFDTDFDQTIGKINVISQDMGRVILNLLTNAFYAVTEKKKALGEVYQPTVSISTRKVGKNVIIRVTDNGNGIPEKIIDKIFQPFFSSKPTGAGTGLGLSMCYEIVTKGHGGKIEVESKEGEGAVMTVTIPT